MSVFYVKFNENSIVTGISELNAEIDNPNMIQIDTYDITLLGKKYVNGEFVQVPKTKDELLQELKSAYLSLISDADLLGDIEEKERLQQEYLTKKAEIEAQYTE